MEKYNDFDLIDPNMVVKSGIECETLCNLLPSVPPKPVNIACFGITPPNADYHIKRNKCGYFVLEYVYTGKGTVINNGEAYSVETGDVYLLKPGSIHEYYADKKHPYGKYWVNFRGDIFLSVLDAFHIENCTVFKRVNIENQFKQLFALENISMQNDLIYTQASAIIFDMLMNCVATGGMGDNISYYAGRLQREMDVCITKHKSLDEICKKLYISKAYAIREFKRHFGTTPHDYLVNKRMELAKHLLTHTKQSIQDIAEVLCFSDPHYFSNFFKQKVGMSPKQYRNLYRDPEAN